MFPPVAMAIQDTLGVLRPGTVVGSGDGKTSTHRLLCCRLSKPTVFIWSRGSFVRTRKRLLECT